MTRRLVDRLRWKPMSIIEPAETGDCVVATHRIAQMEPCERVAMLEARVIILKMLVRGRAEVLGLRLNGGKL